MDHRVVIHPGSVVTEVKCALCGVQWKRAEVPVHIPNDHTDADWEAYRVANGLTNPYPRFLVVESVLPHTAQERLAMRLGTK